MADLRTNPPSQYGEYIFDPAWYDYIGSQKPGRRYPLAETLPPDPPLKYSDIYGHPRFRGRFNLNRKDPYFFPQPPSERFQPTKRTIQDRMTQAQALLDKGYYVPVPSNEPSYLDFGKGIGKLPIDLGALPGMTPEEAGGPSRRAAGVLQGIEDYGTLPFYFFPPTALAAGTLDVTRGILNRDVLEITLSMLGVAKPLASVPRAVSEAFEKTYLKATGSLGVATFLNNLADKLFPEPAWSVNWEGPE
jgi:hypothetical protein